MDQNKKLFINNCVTFIILLLAFYSANNYLTMINNEVSYRNYLNEINKPSFMLLDNAPEIETLKIGFEFYLFVSLSLILILNGLYYIVMLLYKRDTTPRR